MTIVFVNDGSTDRTQEIVDQPEFDEVLKVRFKHNKGYGAAIKAGWRAAGDVDLLGFVDADGTCDPDHSVHLINRLVETDADVVLAGRMTAQSEMPKVRRLGNLLFANMLNAVSSSKITDCASGFRVVRRSSLAMISPLPKGLHFTPAMSAICLLDPRLRIEEVPMPYKERIGRSKLSVLKDGFRFLYVILFTICCYTPIRTMFSIAAAWMLVVAALAALTHSLGGSSAVGPLALAGGLVALQCAWTGVVCHQLNFLLIGPRRKVNWAERLLQRFTEYKFLIVSGLTMLAAGLGLFVALGATSGLSFNALLGLTLLTVLGASTALAGVILRVIWAVGEKQKALLQEGHWDERPMWPVSESTHSSALGNGTHLEGASVVVRS
jgi:hypothetical protein